MKLLAYLFIYKAKRLPLFGKFMDMHLQTEERSRESKRVIGSKHLDIDNHFFSQLFASSLFLQLQQYCRLRKCVV